MDKYVLKNARLETLGITADIEVENGRIAGIGKFDDGERIFDLNEKILLPGFIDQHTHGAMNVDVNNGTVGDLEQLRVSFASFGTTAFFPAVLSDSEAVTKECISRITEAARGTEGARIAGIHLEGPFLSPQYKGAMPEQFLRNPDFELFMEYYAVSEGLLRLITISPELPGACEFTKRATAEGIRVSVGHSGATYEQTVDCIKAGAASGTHTFNAMKLLHQHFPAILGAVLEQDIYCEAICDGRHLCPAIVRLLLKTKGFDRVIAVTDSIMAAGMPDGKYKLGVNDIVVVDGDAQLADGSSRAGSTLTTIGALNNIIKFTGCTIAEASKLLSENPARMLGMFDDTGSIETGKSADFVILDGNLQVLCTIVDGKFAFGTPGQEVAKCH